MLEKTQKFLKKEISKRAEPNDDHCATFWKEKAEIAWVIFSEYYAYLSAITYSEGGKQRRTKLQENLSEFQNAKRDSDREQWLVFGYSHSGKDDDYIKTLKSFFSPKYESPDDIYEKIFQTVVIYRYYRNLLPLIGIPSWTIDAKVDLALFKLARGISAVIHTMDSQITQKDQVMYAALQRKKTGTEYKEAINNLLKSFDIKKDLQCFRGNKNKSRRKQFIEKAREVTKNPDLTEKAIMDIARDCLSQHKLPSCAIKFHNADRI